ncbi:MAG: PspA/IM30 family protein [Pseudomonadota bacterium]
MTETIGKRVGRLVSGGFNALIDAVENSAPDAVMQQTIREVDEAIADVRAELGKVVANKHLASRRLMDENQRHGELDGQIRIALDSGRDDLAEAAVAKQMDIEAQIPVLEKSVSDAGEQERELEGYVLALQARRREMEAEYQQFLASREAAQSTPGSAGASGAAKANDSVEEATAAFDRVMARTTGLPGGARAESREDASRLAELDKLSREHRIRERLARLKAEPKSE